MKQAHNFDSAMAHFNQQRSARSMEKFWMKPLVPMAKDYFELLVAEATTIPEDYGPDPSRPAMFKKWTDLKHAILKDFNDKKEVSLTCVFEMETLQIKLLPDERIRTKAWSVRANYTSIISKDLMQKYIETNPPDLKSENPSYPKIRADVEDLTTGLHWWYVNAHRKEMALRRLKLKLLWAVLIGLLFVVLMTAGLTFGKGCFQTFLSQLTPVEMILYVMYSGFLGAITSTIRRIQPIADAPISVSDPLVKSMAFEQGSVGVYLSTALGAIFALVLYLAFAAGLQAVVGTSAPEFRTVSESMSSCGSSLCEFFWALLPKSSADFAKALVWSFIGGFSEKLVPDMLDRLQTTKS